MTQRSTLKTASFLVLLASITQGLCDHQLLHDKTKEAMVGQNASLTCSFKNTSSITVVGIEWRKKDSKPSKLALYMPLYGYQYFSPNVTLKMIKNDQNEVIGTHVELLNINKGDAGTYICDFSTFPYGSLRGETELKIKDEIECDMNSSIEVSSGENMTILCHEFTDVTYTWTKDEVVVSDSSSLHLQSVSTASAGLYTLTVHTGNSVLQKAFNIAVTIQTTTYWEDAWTESPRHSSSSESETTRYSQQNTTFATENTQNATSTLPIVYSQTVNIQNTSDSTMYHTSLSYNQSETSEGFDTHNATLRYNDSESIDIVSNVSQLFNPLETFPTDTSYNHSVTIHTTLPVVIDKSTDNTSVIYDSAPYETENPSTEFKSTTSAPTTFLQTAMINPGATMSSLPRNTPDNPAVTTQKDPAHTEGRLHLGLTLIIITGGVLLIIVAIIMYRRRVIKKRMDLPPPFKPPPPPVKYAAVRNPPEPFPVDRCNSLMVPCNTEMKLTYV